LWMKDELIPRGFFYIEESIEQNVGEINTALAALNEEQLVHNKGLNDARMEWAAGHARSAVM
jgi:hypothetical protein